MGRLEIKTCSLGSHRAFDSLFRALHKASTSQTVFRKICMYVCLLITLTRSPKAELRRAQLNGIGRMPMKGASGCRQTVMNDPEAQQPSQMFLTWAKARLQHRNSVPYSLRIVCAFFTTRVVRRDLRLIVLIREELKV